MLNLDRSYRLPIVISVILHVGVLAWLGGSWSVAANKPVTPPVSYVKATLVELKPKTSAPVATTPKVTKPKVDLEAKRREAERLKQQQAEKERQLAAKRKAEKEQAEKLAEQKKRAEEKKQREQEAARQAAEALKRQEQARQQEVADALAAEQAMLAEQQAEATAQSYVAVMKDKIARNWSRPASARNGMVCWLRIQMIPSGEVINVTVIKGSGNEAFDRSAEQAVRLAGQFEVLRQAPPAVFEKYFRQLTLKFSPEDLRL